MRDFEVCLADSWQLLWLAILGQDEENLRGGVRFLEESYFFLATQSWFSTYQSVSSVRFIFVLVISVDGTGQVWSATTSRPISYALVLSFFSSSGLIAPTSHVQLIYPSFWLWIVLLDIFILVSVSISAIFAKLLLLWAYSWTAIFSFVPLIIFSQFLPLSWIDSIPSSFTPMHLAISVAPLLEIWVSGR